MYMYLSTHVSEYIYTQVHMHRSTHVLKYTCTGVHVYSSTHAVWRHMYCSKVHTCRFLYGGSPHWKHVLRQRVTETLVKQRKEKENQEKCLYYNQYLNINAVTNIEYIFVYKLAVIEHLKGFGTYFDRYEFFLNSIQFR